MDYRNVHKLKRKQTGTQTNLNTHMNKRILRIICLVCMFVTAMCSHASENNENASAWEQLQNGIAMAVMRHALAPGTGDPINFLIDDCTTQRNLSADGQAQAIAIGQLFREKGVADAQVLSSEWCRCQETARLLNLGKPVLWPSLNSFFQDRSTAENQTNQLLEAMPEWLRFDDKPTVLVTHQVNISALTGQFARSGEILIISLNGNDIRVLASIETLD